MGVLHPLQIASYSINSIEFTDVLRIVYERPKGSKLPGTRTYKFPRVQKALKKTSVKDILPAVMESDPALKGILEELKDVTALRSQNLDVAALMREELRLLQEDIALRSEYLKTLVDKINKV
jgi:hypothetical protein